MRYFVTLLLLTNTLFVFAQRKGVWYRTVSEEENQTHYLIFSKNKTCHLIFENQLGTTTLSQDSSDFEFRYQINNDTISFYGNELVQENVVRRIRDSKFIVLNDQSIHDCISGYTYVDRKHARYMVYSINGEVFKQRLPKVEGDGSVKEYKANRKLKKSLQKININNVSMMMLTGKEAYQKYGKLGMNGVIEITGVN